MERLIERLLFASRWVLVPLYIGLALFLLVIAIAFFNEGLRVVLALPGVDGTEVILSGLSLVDLVLVASLLVMIMMSGYGNFVSKLHIEQQNLTWLGKLDTGSIKLKITGSIVAISSINLLHAAIDVKTATTEKLMWLVIIQLTFVVSAVALTIVDHRIPAEHRE
jgi:uncharacterized protein (TIGR00645 family)